MTPPAAQNLVQRALGGHAAIGLLASALLYIVALTGTLAVLNDRWQRWEQPDMVEAGALSPDAAQAAMRHVLAADGGRRTGHVVVRMPSERLPRALVTTDAGGRFVDARGRIIGREGTGWSGFIVALHEDLCLPGLWGAILVGMLGVALAALAVTGVLAHPRIVRDAFHLRIHHSPQIARTDWHNRLGVWTLPFIVAIALTGAFFGLGSLGATMLAKAYAGGRIEQVYAPIFGGETAPDPAPAGPPDLAAAMRTLAAIAPEAEPTFVIAHDPGTRGQHIQIIAEHPRRLIFGETYTFDAAGRWRGTAGLADGAVGQQVAASAYKLHFGDYGGLAVELAYLGLGLALCVVTATGPTLWLTKRLRRGLGGLRLIAGWTAIVWGVPLILTVLVWVRAAAGAQTPFPWLFWAALAAAVAGAMAAPAALHALRPRLVALAAIALTAAAHLAYILTLPDRAPPTLAIDLAAIVATAAVILMLERPRPVWRLARLSHQPAE